eukprot:TRINITY_DN4486_c0_g1_i1.p1 TRINITY_DN4486_c0_g1~~TRINITY_DN4486_c0_g1_i1.p1  ORF type:complete len:434 (+),score=117.94 TRINITY_DN4486_c0_g1_i1:61-1302(+)
MDSIISSRLRQLEDRMQELDRREELLSKQEISAAGSSKSASGFGSVIGYYRLSLIERVTHQFDSSKEIGRGGFGRVFKANIGMVEVAIKRMEKSEGGRQGELEFLQEISIASSCKHPSIVPLIGFCFERKERLLIYPLMKGGNLEDRLQQNTSKRLDCSNRLQIAIQIAEGIAFLHNSEGGERPIIYHRDIKPSNILLDLNDNAKLSDVGTSKYDNGSAVGGDVTSTTMRIGCVGSLGYTDPEYLTSMHYTAASDVFSFGVVMLRLWTGLPAMQNNQPLNMKMKMLLKADKKMTTAINHADPASGQWPLAVASQFAKIAMRCVKDSFERPTMEEVVELLTAIKQDHFKQQEVLPISEDERCCICMTQPRGECVMVPCKHAETCLDCALEIISKSGTGRCPICKKKIEDLLESN